MKIAFLKALFIIRSNSLFLMICLPGRSNYIVDALLLQRGETIHELWKRRDTG
ncbi:MAG: hypothetical protein ABJA71_10180 [Ginsengibacter sp.]